jgi:hypothetical protein
MKNRCYNEKQEAYPHYGGRGITVCDRWLNSFQNFLEDVGLAPSHSHQVGRIDNDGHYEPGNVRWETQKEQLVNRRKFPILHQHPKLPYWVTKVRRDEEILRLHSEGMRGNAIAVRFGVSESLVSRVISGERRSKYLDNAA